jgi:hypothetical protein
LTADEAIARYLLSDAPVAERDQAAHQLLTDSDISPLDLELLGDGLQRLRRLPPEGWLDFIETHSTSKRVPS